MDRSCSRKSFDVSIQLGTAAAKLPIKTAPSRPLVCCVSKEAAREKREEAEHAELLNPANERDSTFSKTVQTLLVNTQLQQSHLLEAEVRRYSHAVGHLLTEGGACI